MFWINKGEEGESTRPGNMIEKQWGEMPLLLFPNLEKTGIINQGFTTRIGGVSKGQVGTMNISFTRGDDPGCVKENLRRVADALGTNLSKMVFSHQTHTTNIRLVTEEDCGKGPVIPLDYSDTDGLITNIPGICLVTMYADCVPLYFVDPVHKAIGLSHSGWRGTVHRMGQETVKAMGEAFGTRPEDLYVAIGPSICQECYEVTGDVIEKIKAAFDPKWWNELFYQTDELHYQLDLWRANEIVLLESGVHESRMEVAELCTCCNHENLFSHRASNGKRGNLGAFLMLKEG